MVAMILESAPKLNTFSRRVASAHFTSKATAKIASIPFLRQAEQCSQTWQALLQPYYFTVSCCAEHKRVSSKASFDSIAWFVVDNYFIRINDNDNNRGSKRQPYRFNPCELIRWRLGSSSPG